MELLLFFFFFQIKIMSDTLPIDSSMIDRWTNQWLKQLGFNDEQLVKRNTKVEQFARVRSDFPIVSILLIVAVLKVCVRSNSKQENNGYN